MNDFQLVFSRREEKWEYFCNDWLWCVRLHCGVVKRKTSNLRCKKGPNAVKRTIKTELWFKRKIHLFVNYRHTHWLFICVSITLFIRFKLSRLFMRINLYWLSDTMRKSFLSESLTCNSRQWKWSMAIFKLIARLPNECNDLICIHTLINPSLTSVRQLTISKPFHICSAWTLWKIAPHLVWWEPPFRETRLGWLALSLVSLGIRWVLFDFFELSETVH